MRLARDRHARQRGFTLIELLVAITIIGILLTLSVGGAYRYFGSARTNATGALLQNLNAGVTARAESFWFKVKPPALMRHQWLAGVPAALAPTGEPLARRSNRAALLAKLEAMRGDFPQQFADFIAGKQTGAGWSNPAGGLANAENTAAAGAVPAVTDNIQPVASRHRAAIERLYRSLTYAANSSLANNNDVVGSPPPGRALPTVIAPHDPNTESAACLYLMLKVGGGEGQAFDLDGLPPKYIKDTDGDGVPEIVDDWGQPVRFCRWPTDYHYHAFFRNNAYGNDAVNNLDPTGLLTSSVWNASALGGAFQSNPLAGATVAAHSVRLGNFFRVRHPARTAAGADVEPYTGTAAMATLSIPTWPIIVSGGPGATEKPDSDKWQAFGLQWWATAATPVPPAGGSSPWNTKITVSWPPVTDLPSRCARPVDPDAYPTTYPTSTFEAGQYGTAEFGDNLQSLGQRAGQGQ